MDKTVATSMTSLLMLQLNIFFKQPHSFFFTKKTVLLYPTASLEGAMLWKLNNPAMFIDRKPFVPLPQKGQDM